MATNASRDFLKAAATPMHPGIAFEVIGQVFVGQIVGEPQVKPTKDIGKETTTDKMMVSMVCNGEKTTAYYNADENGRQVKLPCVNGETYTLWVKPFSSMARAINEACAAAGTDMIEEGGLLGVQYLEDGERKQGMNPPKLYVAQYAKPAKGVAVGSLI